MHRPPCNETSREKKNFLSFLFPDMLDRLCLVAAALGVASGFPTALTCGERELEVGGPKIMGIVPYESERTLMVMRANGEMLSDGDTIAPSEKLTVKVSDTAGQVQLRAEGHGAWGDAACTDGGDGGVSCINNEWETTLCTFAGDADAAVTIWAGHAEGSGAPGVAVTKKFTLKVGTDSAQAPADVEVATDGETQTTVAAADRDSTVAAADRETTDAEASSVRSQPEERTPIARAAPSDLPEQLASAREQPAAASHPPSPPALSKSSDGFSRETVGWVAVGFGGGLLFALSAGAVLFINARKGPVAPAQAAVEVQGGQRVINGQRVVQGVIDPFPTFQRSNGLMSN